MISSTNHMGMLLVQTEIWGVVLKIEQYILATEWWVHVSRLLVPHLDRN